MDGGRYSSLSLDNSGNPHIVYSQWDPSTGYDIKYSTYKDSQWEPKTIWSSSFLRTRYPEIRIDNANAKIALDSNGNSHIVFSSYSDVQNNRYIGGLVYLLPYGNSWVYCFSDTKDIESVSLALDPWGLPHISYLEYRRNSYALRYAYLSVPNIEGTWASLDASWKGDYQVLNGKLELNNTGTGIAKRFKVAFYLSEDDVYDFGDVPLGKAKRGPSLKPGTSKILRFAYKSQTSLSGKYIVAVLDFEGAVYELEKKDNLAIVLIP